LSLGERGARTGIPFTGGEIGALARAFGSMAESLEQREAQRRQAENEVRRLNDELEKRVAERTIQLEEANGELEAFSYSVSHDLRAPLRHMNGFIDLLAKSVEGAIDEKGPRYLGVIKNACNRMSTLIDDLLSFSRIGREALDKTPVRLGDLVGEVVAEVQRDAAGRRIEWKIGELPEVTADRRLLKQAFINLLDNAVKYTRPRETAVIEVDCRRRDGEAVVRVGDNGIGFDNRFAARLFGVFQRLHATEQFEGSGIGLANVRRIITRHGGRVWAEGEPDKGSSFFISLPERGE
jgi:light-regulated signal transduction histidine kinase (bacteriophytochrome)